MKTRQQGLIKLIVIVVVAILILSYFRVDLRNLIENKLTRENFGFLWSGVKAKWSCLTK